MSNASNPADPSNYKSHPMGYCCKSCNASARIGVATRHGWLCEIAPQEFVLPSNQEENASGPADRKANAASRTFLTKQAKTTRPSIKDVAKDGSARLHYSDAEIAAAVDSGTITESDAMNQDF